MKIGKLLSLTLAGLMISRVFHSVAGLTPTEYVLNQ